MPKIKATLEKDEKPLRLGILSAAAINYTAIIDPIQTHPGVILVGIAARQASKAQAQIDLYKLGPTCKAYGSYAELLADASIDIVYVPLPNGLHCEWAIKSLEAGKHVLIEKPIAANAEQARQIHEAASKTGRVALEAFHWRFHPAAHQVKAMIESGKYGAPRSIYVRFKVPNGTVDKDNIALKYDLAGGACMGLTYVFDACSYFASSDLTACEFNVVEVVPRLNETDKRVDEAMESKSVIEQDGKPPVNCHVQADMRTPNLFGIIPKFWQLAPLVVVELEKARIEFSNFVIPAYFHSITITEKGTGQKRTERYYVDGPEWGSRGKPWWTTYRYQLEAFVDVVRVKEAEQEYVGPWMQLDESVKVMEMIDAVYDKAGLPRRGI